MVAGTSSHFVKVPDELASVPLFASVAEAVSPSTTVSMVVPFSVPEVSPPLLFSVVPPVVPLLSVFSPVVPPLSVVPVPLLSVVPV
jgi:hypothetical protein